MNSLCWPLYRKYEDHKKEREHEREQYRREQRRRGRRDRFVFPRELQPVPMFSEWVQEEVRHDQQEGIVVDHMVVDTSTGPLRVISAQSHHPCVCPSPDGSFSTNTCLMPPNSPLTLL